MEMFDFDDLSWLESVTVVTQPPHKNLASLNLFLPPRYEACKVYFHKSPAFLWQDLNTHFTSDFDNVLQEVITKPKLKYLFFYLNSDQYVEESENEYDKRLKWVTDYINQNGELFFEPQGFISTLLNGNPTLESDYYALGYVRIAEDTIKLMRALWTKVSFLYFFPSDNLEDWNLLKTKIKKIPQATLLHLGEICKECNIPYYCYKEEGGSRFYLVNP